jgi:hypothetical protein
MPLAPPRRNWKADGTFLNFAGRLLPFCKDRHMAFASSTDMGLHPSVISFPEGEIMSGQWLISAGRSAIDGSVPEKA